MTASSGNLLAATAGHSRLSRESSTSSGILFSLFIAGIGISFAKTGSIPVAQPWESRSFMITTRRSNEKGS
jgi:hypothetical protein